MYHFQLSDQTTTAAAMVSTEGHDDGGSSDRSSCCPDNGSSHQNLRNGSISSNNGSQHFVTTRHDYVDRSGEVPPPPHHQQSSENRPCSGIGGGAGKLVPFHLKLHDVSSSVIVPSCVLVSLFCSYGQSRLPPILLSTWLLVLLIPSFVQQRQQQMLERISPCSTANVDEQDDNYNLSEGGASWQPHGRAFRIGDPRVCEEVLLPRYFQSNMKMSSFRRQLNLYGCVAAESRENADDEFYRAENSLITY